MLRPLTILSAAFSLATVSADAVGGAEQVLSEIDRELVAQGHRSIVIASRRSQVAGLLVPGASLDGASSHQDWIGAHARVREAISSVLREYPVDLVHMHGVDFASYVPEVPVPVLVTLHLPLEWYGEGLFSFRRPRTFFNCVSRAQHRDLTNSPALGCEVLPEIENGVRVDLLRRDVPVRKRDFVAAMGRICPEKGFHLALRAAKKARLGMLLAGRVFPFTEHQSYFAEQIIPELDGPRRFIGPIALTKKIRFLSAAKCTVVTSLVPETSSLVARESLACGTPVVAFRRGALPEAIDSGRTGYIVDDERDLPDAIRACDRIDARHCREAAEERFSAAEMVNHYIRAYRGIVEGERQGSYRAA